MPISPLFPRAALLAAVALAGVAFAADPPAPGMGRPPRPTMRMKPPETRAEAEADARAMFARFDLNHDGVVTRDEVTGAMAAMRKQMRDGMFDRLDTNKDGAISRAEFDAAHDGWRNGHDMPPPPPPGGSGAASPPPPPSMHHGMKSRRPGSHGMDGAGRMARMFDRIDTNHDGRISEAEAVAAADARFDRVDTNHDGTISREERRAGWRMHRPGGPGDMPPPGGPGDMPPPPPPRPTR